MNKHVEIIKNKEGEMLAVSSDPKTFEMRRDLNPEVRQFRLKYLKRDFKE